MTSIEKLTKLLQSGIDADVMLCGAETFYCYLTEYGVGTRGEHFTYGFGKTLDSAIDMAFDKIMNWDKQ